MKIYLYLLIALTSSFSFSQTKGRVTYKIISEKLTSDGNKKVFVEYLNNLNEIRDSLYLNLDFHNYESTFYVDDETNIGLSNEKGYKPIINSFKTYYKNDLTKISIKLVNLDKIYSVKSKTANSIWKITKEKKRIGNYTCIKAIAKVDDKHPTRGLYTKQIDAWFCPEIAISLGPNNYGGLPGLIMELKEGKFTYYVKNINLKPDFEIKIEKPKGKVITQKEYFDIIPTITRENIKEYIGN